MVFDGFGNILGGCLGFWILNIVFLFENGIDCCFLVFWVDLVFILFLLGIFLMFDNVLDDIFKDVVGVK